MLEVPAIGDVPSLLEEECANVPVFPLPNVVFFPHTTLPLHLFEPRYRKMVADAIARGPGSPLAVVLLKPGWEGSYSGRPPLHEVAGVGRIIAHEKVSDGRYNVALAGLSRVRLDELPVDGLPYRRARVSILDDHGEAELHDVTALMSCAGAVAAVVRRQYPEFDLELTGYEGPGTLADRIADRLVADVGMRQQLLETLDVGARVRAVTDVVSDLVAMLRAGRRSERPD